MLRAERPEADSLLVSELPVPLKEYSEHFSRPGGIDLSVGIHSTPSADDVYISTTQPTEQTSVWLKVSTSSRNPKVLDHNLLCSCNQLVPLSKVLAGPTGVLVFLTDQGVLRWDMGTATQEGAPTVLSTQVWQDRGLHLRQQSIAMDPTSRDGAHDVFSIVSHPRGDLPIPAAPMVIPEFGFYREVILAKRAATQRGDCVYDPKLKVLFLSRPTHSLELLCVDPNTGAHQDHGPALRQVLGLVDQEQDKSGASPYVGIKRVDTRFAAGPLGHFAAVIMWRGSSWTEEDRGEEDEEVGELVVMHRAEQTKWKWVERGRRDVSWLYKKSWVKFVVSVYGHVYAINTPITSFGRSQPPPRVFRFPATTRDDLRLVRVMKAAQLVAPQDPTAGGEGAGRRRRRRREVEAVVDVLRFVGRHVADSLVGHCCTEVAAAARQAIAQRD